MHIYVHIYFHYAYEREKSYRWILQSLFLQMVMKPLLGSKSSFLCYLFYISLSFREFFHWDSLPRDNEIIILERFAYLVKLFYYRLPITFSTRYGNVRGYSKDSPIVLFALFMRE